tara:strand:+ start:177 stop:1196 length:1020 start_codon:yes stop_codon:yes gene_type:complete
MFHRWHRKQKPVFTGFRYGFGRVEVATSEDDGVVSQDGTYLNRGYWSGRNNRATIEVEWATDTTVLTGRGQGPDFESGGASGWSTTSYGWWFGGYTNQEGSKTDIYRLDYSNDTTDLADRANLNNGKGGGMQGGHNTTYGYVSGSQYGNSGGKSSKVERITFASESGSASQRVNQVEGEAACNSTGTDTSTYLWFLTWTYGGSGGVAGANRTYSYRLTYSSDTSALSNRLDAGGGSGKTASTKDDGWLGASDGYVDTSYIRRITWASDDSGLSNRGTFPHANKNWSGSMNTDYIWWWHDSGSQSNLYRMGMSTDTVTAEQRAQASITNSKTASITSSLG